MPKKKQPDSPNPPARHFSLAPNHSLAQSGYGSLVRPSYSGGLAILTSPGGLPVVRHHQDLRPNEVNFILR